MKYAIFLFLGIIFYSCSKNEIENTDPFITHDAHLLNGLAGDGCAWHFQIDSVSNPDYVAASQKSHKLVLDTFIKNTFIKLIEKEKNLFSDKVEITYRFTRNKRDLLCGFGVMVSTDEIEVKAIRKI